MTAEDITQIERELGMTVPGDYRALITAYPTELPAEARGYDLLDHPSYVIAENRSARGGTVYGIRWPEQYFIIGHDGSGGWFCLDTQRSHSPVIYFDHEDRSFREVAGEFDRLAAEDFSVVCRQNGLTIGSGRTAARHLGCQAGR